MVAISDLQRALAAGQFEKDVVRTGTTGNYKR
jgi:hypothetical protein